MRYFNFLVLSCMLLFSCVDDKSTIDNIALNNITIGELDDSYSVMIGENLQITPELSADNDDLSYLWYIYAKGVDVRDTLATTRNLDVLIGGDKMIPGKDYTLVYRVIDNKSGVFVSRKTTVMAMTNYTQGTLVLCDIKGERTLNIVLPNGNILKNIYQTNNGGKIGKYFISSVFFKYQCL